MFKEITTAEEAFKRNKDQVDLQQVKDSLAHLPGKFLRGMIALLTLQVIIHEVNNDDPAVAEWKPDYNNTNQKKWFPWYRGGDSTGAGFRFDGTGYDWTAANTCGGARLALKDEERAEHMNEHFSDLYKDLYLILE